MTTWLLNAIDLALVAAAVAIVKYLYPRWNVPELYELHTPIWMPEYCAPCAVFWTFVVLWSVKIFVIYAI